MFYYCWFVGSFGPHGVGCTWKELRFSLSIRTPPIPTLDRHTEVYLWKKLLFDKDIILQTLPEPRVTFPLLGRQLRIDEEYRPFPFSLNTVLEGDLRGSCGWFERRKDVTEEMRQSEVSLTEVEEKLVMSNVGSSLLPLVTWSSVVL